MKYKRTKNEKEIKKQEIKNLKTICKAKMASATDKETQFHFFKWHMPRITIQNLLREKKWKKMQDNEGEDESLCWSAIKKLKMSMSEITNGNKKSGRGRRRLGLVGALQWHRRLVRRDHFLRRATSDTGGAMIDYD